MSIVTMKKFNFFWRGFCGRKNYLGAEVAARIGRARERTQEVDYLAERNGNLHAFDFKWSDLAVKKARLPLTFSSSFKNTEFSVISPQNVEDFLL